MTYSHIDDLYELLELSILSRSAIHFFSTDGTISKAAMAVTWFIVV